MKKVRVKIISKSRFSTDGIFLGFKPMEILTQEVEEAFNELVDEGYQIDYRFEKHVEGFILVGKLPPESPFQVIPPNQPMEDLKVAIGDKLELIVAYSFIEAIDLIVVKKGISEKEAVNEVVLDAINQKVPLDKLNIIADACLKMADEHEKTHKIVGHDEGCTKPEYLRNLAGALKEVLQRHVS